MALLPILATATMPPKESGTWIDVVFDWCVELLLSTAAKLGVSYNAINVWVFCIIWPVLTLFLIAVAFYQRVQIRRLVRNSPPMG